MSADTAKCLKRASAATLVAGWVLLALFVGEMQLLGMLPLPGVQIILFSLTALVLFAYWRMAPARAFVDSLPIRALVLFHLTRFVGIYFLVLYARGELPYVFAVLGGWGDIAVAVGAAMILLLPAQHPVTRRALLVWNAIGLVDILFVVAVAAQLGVSNPASMRALTKLPLSFLPLLIVPLIIATHIFIFVRLLKKAVPTVAPAQVERALPL